MNKLYAFLIVFLVLFFDQSLKLWVKTNMMLNTEFPVFGDWFIIHFSENKGMAFGMEFGGDTGKLILSLFRIIAVIFIGYFINKLIKEKAHWGFITAMCLIFAGAMGNIIDSVFYGWLFDSSRGQLASFMPEGGGYAAPLYGHVVDMLYFPIFKGYLPDWVPLWGGQYKVFFQPIFNIADSAISVGVFIILLFNKLFFKEPETTETPQTTEMKILP